MALCKVRKRMEQSAIFSKKRADFREKAAKIQIIVLTLQRNWPLYKRHSPKANQKTQDEENIPYYIIPHDGLRPADPGLHHRH